MHRLNKLFWGVSGQMLTPYYIDRRLIVKMAKTKIVDKNALSQYTEEMKGYIKSQGLGLTEEDINGLIDIKLVPVNETIEDKVDKVDGMGLSTNDYTDEDKLQVETNKSDILSLQEDVEKLNSISSITTDAIDSLFTS